MTSLQAAPTVLSAPVPSGWLRQRVPKKSKLEDSAGNEEPNFSSKQLSSKLAEVEAEAEADAMNTYDKVKDAFNLQISAASTASNISTPSLAELSSPEFFSRQCSEIDSKATKVVFEAKVKDAFLAVVADCHFCVTVADPRDPDVPLIAVSDQFQATTGFTKAELIGRNCRVLRAGCLSDPIDLLCLRACLKTGSSFTAVLNNRRKTGEHFLNLLDLRGLTVARNPWTGEELWFLVGIQADVTNFGLSQSQEYYCKEHLPKLAEIANSIRSKLVDELKDLAVSGALMRNFEGHDEIQVDFPQDAWCILPEPQWRNGGHLRPTVISPLLVNPVLSNLGGQLPYWAPNQLQYPSLFRSCGLDVNPEMSAAASLLKHWQVVFAATGLGGLILLSIFSLKGHHPGFRFINESEVLSSLR